MWNTINFLLANESLKYSKVEPYFKKKKPRYFKLKWTINNNELLIIVTVNEMKIYFLKNCFEFELSGL